MFELRWLVLNGNAPKLQFRFWKNHPHGWDEGRFSEWEDVPIVTAPQDTAGTTGVVASTVALDVVIGEFYCHSTHGRVEILCPTNDRATFYARKPDGESCIVSTHLLSYNVWLSPATERSES